MANWVRFADTKATILIAGLGVTLTMLMANAKTIATAIKLGWAGAITVGALACVTLLAFCYTLYWLLRAITPACDVSYTALNRFAWPTLVNSSTVDLIAHAETTDVRKDLWQQVIDLSGIARRKFDGCSRAIRGFAVFVVMGVACVATAIGFVS